MKETPQEATGSMPSSASTEDSRDSAGHILVSFEEDDPTNPHNWKRVRVRLYLMERFPVQKLGDLRLTAAARNSGNE